MIARSMLNSRTVIACVAFAATLAVEVLLITLAGLAWLFFTRILTITQPFVVGQGCFSSVCR